jgi:hypothetical protein
VRQHHQGRIGRAKSQVTIPLDDLTRGAQFVPRQALDDVRAHREVLKETELDADPKARQDQVVCFRDGELRRHERLALGHQDPRHRFVPWLLGVRLSKEGSGVHDQGHYSRPMTFV